MSTPSAQGTMFDQTTTPDAPGSNDITGPYMQLNSLPDVVNTTESDPQAPIEDQHAIEVLEYNEANEEDISFFDDEDFEFNTVEMAGQPLAQHSTQPPPGVTNMGEGSTSNGGANQYNVETRTEGGTTGTTPDSTPMSKGYGEPGYVSRANADELNLDVDQEEEEDILPPENEMLINEFDSLL